MCDTCLSEFPARVGRVGDELILYQFRPDTRAFTYAQALEAYAEPFLVMLKRLGFWKAVMAILAPTRPKPFPVVQLQHGTMLEISGITFSVRRKLGLKIGEEAAACARMVQLAGDPNICRDALEIEHRKVLAIQAFEPGLRARIVSVGDDFGWRKLHEDLEPEGVAYV